MNKQEKIIVGVLILVLVLYTIVGPLLAPPPQVVPEAAEPVPPSLVTDPGVDGTTNATAPQITQAPPPVLESAQPDEGSTPGATTPASPPRKPLGPEITHTLESDELRIVFSSHGGAIRSATLKKYPNSLDATDGPLVFAFTNKLALAIAGIVGLGPGDAYSFTPDSDPDHVTMVAETDQGVRYARTIRLEPGYQLAIADTFENAGDEPRRIPAHQIQLGVMRLSESAVANVGPTMPYLGVDTIASKGGEKVRHHGTKKMFSRGAIMTDYFYPDQKAPGCMSSMFSSGPKQHLPVYLRETVTQETDWVAVKNKFFAQILSYPGEAAGFVLEPRRLLTPTGEDPANPATWMRTAVLHEVSATMMARGFALPPGESLTREMSYYIGPKKLSLMKQLGHHQEEVMEFGKLKLACEPLLKLLNLLHAMLPNYGVAIILLTMIIKIVFWPITHKSTENMKRMSALQPKMKEIQAKFKDKPEKIQAATMALYKEHKVNPVAGCLPMVIQIPVFIALFTVLRSAVELRYAGFIWIQDLSEPEGLFAEFFTAIPMIPALNILPIFMTGLTFLQQKLTPSTADPQQQRIMMMMPVVFLFILYNMASGLVLYWSINQVLSIVQLLIQQKKNKTDKDD